MKKVIFLYGDSLSNIFEELGRSWTQPFLELGRQLIPLRMRGDAAFRSTLNELLDDDADFVFGLGGAGHALSVTAGDPDAPGMWEHQRIPYLGIYGDSPAYAADFHRQRGPYSISLYTFSEHLRLRREMPLALGLLGPARPAVLNVRPRAAIDFERKKQGKILFLKNGNSPRELYKYWDTAFNPGTRKHLFALKEVVQAQLPEARPAALQDLVEEYLRQLGAEPANLLRLKLLLIAQMDDFARRRKSELVADVMLDFPTEVRGLGWGHLGAAPRVGRLIEECDYARSNQLMEEALALVDMSPNTDSGFHDRVCRAAGASTLCITNDQGFVHQHLAHAERFSYRFTRDSIAERIALTLADPAQTIALGIDVADQFASQFVLKDELLRWMDLADLVRTNAMTERPRDTPRFLVWPPTTF